MDCLYNPKQVIVVRKDLNMRKGKLAAQVAHASNKFIESVLEYVFKTQNDIKNIDKNKAEDIIQTYLIWTEQELYRKIVVGCDSEDELLLLIEKAKELNINNYPIYDAGLTEFHGKETLTCCAFGPSISYDVDTITKHLKLI